MALMDGFRNEGFRSVRLAKPKKVVTLPPEEKCPPTLAKLRETVIDYFTGDKSRYIDLSTLVESYGDTFEVRVKSFSAVTGLEKLGSGHYSDVYAIDDARVLKIVKTGDSGFARFVRVIKDNPNPHFPKIIYSGTWGGKQVYVMERLEPGCETMRRHFRSAINSECGDNPFMQVQPSIRECARILEENRLQNDLHNDNVMFRGDVPIVNDPCSES